MPRTKGLYDIALTTFLAVKPVGETEVEGEEEAGEDGEEGGEGAGAGGGGAEGTKISGGTVDQEAGEGAGAEGGGEEGTKWSDGTVDHVRMQITFQQKGKRRNPLYIEPCR